MTGYSMERVLIVPKERVDLIDKENGDERDGLRTGIA